MGNTWMWVYLVVLVYDKATLGMCRGLEIGLAGMTYTWQILYPNRVASTLNIPLQWHVPIMHYASIANTNYNVGRPMHDRCDPYVLLQGSYHLKKWNSYTTSQREVLNFLDPTNLTLSFCLLGVLSTYICRIVISIRQKALHVCMVVFHGLLMLTPLGLECLLVVDCIIYTEGHKSVW